MRVALASLMSEPGQVDANLRRLERAARDHAGWGVDILCVGDCFVQGFDAVTFDPARDRELAWSVDSAQVRGLRRLARQVGMALGVGFLERDGERFYSSYLVLGRDGTTLALQRRLTSGWRGPESDPVVYGVGTGVETFELAGRRCAVALCGDLWDSPEPFAAAHPDVLLWPMHRGATGQQWAEVELGTYARQAASVYASVLLVNNVTPAEVPEQAAVGGAAWFRNGRVKAHEGFNSREVVMVSEILATPPGRR